MISPRLTRGLSVAGNAVLWVTALLGAISLVLGIATIAAGVQPLIFRSSSMAPAIEAGALGLARSVDASEVKVDDIVSVTSGEGVRVTHRVVDIDESAGEQVSLTLQGDSNAGPDEEAYLVTEVDRVFFDVPYLGYVANWLASPWAMFAAGIIVALLLASLWSRRSRRDDAPDTPRSGSSAASTAASGAAIVAAVGLATASLAPVPMTEAYFSDPGMFEAGVIFGTNVTIFDLDTTPCVQDGNNIKVRWKVPSSRFKTIWFVTEPGQPPSGTHFKVLDPGGPRDTPVESTFTRNELVNASPGGPPILGEDYDLVGQSQLRGSASTPWVSTAVRRIGISFDATKVNCGSTNLPPALTFTAPVDGGDYTSTQINGLLQSACSRLTPCGTATDANGIYRVEYRLQRTNLTTMCWDPDAFLNIYNYTYSECGTWSTADTVPATPSTGSTPVTWRVKVGTFGNNAFSTYGNYTLYLRVTDNGTPRTVTERTIQFTRR